MVIHGDSWLHLNVAVSAQTLFSALSAGVVVQRRGLYLRSIYISGGMFSELPEHVAQDSRLAWQQSVANRATDPLQNVLSRAILNEVVNAHDTQARRDRSRSPRNAAAMVFEVQGCNKYLNSKITSLEHQQSISIASNWIQQILTGWWQ